MEKKLYIKTQVLTGNDHEAFNNMSDEDFKKHADYAWSLKDFQEVWNDPERDYIILNSDTTVIRFI